MTVRDILLAASGDSGGGGNVTPITQIAVSRTPFAINGNDIFGIAASPTRMVAVGQGGLIYYCDDTDGLNWVETGAGTSNNFSFVRWIPERSEFVAGGLGVVVTSPNGIDWATAFISAPSITSLTWRDVVWVPDVNKYFVVGSGLVIIESSDFGATFTTTLYPAGNNVVLTGCAFNSGVLVVLGRHPTGTVLYYSTNFGSTWLVRYVGGDFLGISYIDGIVVTGNGNGLKTISTDSGGTLRVATHTVSTPSVGDNGKAAGTSTNMVMVASGTTTMYRSTNGGVTWTNVTNTYSGAVDIVWTGTQFVTVGGFGSCSTSTTGASWTSRTTGTSSILNGIAWNGSTFVIVGASGTIRTSPDAVTWTARTSGTAETLRAVEWSPTLSLFVAVGTAKVILSSPDGITWTTRTAPAALPAAATLSDITWGNGRFVVACGVGRGGIIYSTDGINWTQNTSLGSESVVCVEWVGDKFLLGGYPGSTSGFGSILYSTVDGTSIVNTGFFRNQDINGNLIWDTRLSKFVYGTSSAFVVTSSDGLTWSSELLDSNLSDIHGVYSSADKVCFVGAGSSGSTADSNLGNTTNLSDFIPRVSYTNLTLFEGCVFQGVHFAVGQDGVLLRSPTGVTWTKLYVATTLRTNPPTYSPTLNMALIVGEDGTAYTSTDGDTWTPRAISPTVQGLNAAAWFSGTSSFVVVGGAGVVYTSANGVTWIPRTSNTTSALNTVAASSTRVVAAYSNAVTTTTNGSTWFAGNTTTVATPNSIVWGQQAGRFVLVGNSGKINFSTDGTTWTDASITSLTPSYYGTAWDGNEFYICGSDQVILKSSTGATWRYVNSQYTLQSVATGGGTTIIGGHNGGQSYAVCLSTNPTAYTLKNQPNTNTLTAIIYDGTRFIGVGTGSAVRVSSNGGETWTSVTAGAGITLNTIAYNGINVYVAGGGNGALRRSTDLVNWTSPTSGTASNIQTIIWAQGKFTAISAGGTAHSSTDGVTWTQVSTGLPFPTGQGLVFAPELGVYVLGGSSGAIRTSTDGVTWTSRTGASTQNVSAIAWNGSLFVAVHNAGVITTSPDGITWTLRTSGTTNLLNAVGWTGTSFTAVGSGGTILSSSNGITWTLLYQQFNTVSTILNAVAYTGLQYVYATSGGRIWVTSDNANVTIYTPDILQSINGLRYVSTFSSLVINGNSGLILKGT